MTESKRADDSADGADIINASTIQTAENKAANDYRDDADNKKASSWRRRVT